jgi:hypothetical protein
MACSTNGEKRNAYKILVGKPEGKTPLGRPRCRSVDNIKMDPRKIGWDGMVWIDLAQDRGQWRALVNKVMNLRVTSNFGDFLNSCSTCCSLRLAHLLLQFPFRNADISPPPKKCYGQILFTSVIKSCVRLLRHT